MKRRTKPNRPAFNVQPFLDTIERVFPTISTDIHRISVEAGKDFLIVNRREIERGRWHPLFAESLLAILESLWRCGCAPPDWPKPPDDLLRLNVIPIFTGFETSEEGRP